VSVLVFVIVSAVGTLAAPAFAGFASGGQDVFNALIGQPAGTCAFTVVPQTGHSFFGVQTGTGIPIIKGPISGTLPDALSRACIEVIST
jgi:hypothetical protein